MRQDSFDNKPENEVDIVALFEYFKNGIKSIFRGIANFFKWILRVIVNLLYLIYKNWFLVFGLMLLFGLLGMFKNSLLGTKYKYEMVVEPQFNSTFELYDQIASLNQLLTSKNASTNEFESIREISIKPVERLKDEVGLYYSTTKNTELIRNPDKFGYQRDTVFYNNVEFEEFQEKILETDYPIHLISIRSSEPINVEKIKSLILDPFVNGETWKTIQSDKLSRLKTKEVVFQNVINRADSLLRAYAQNPKLSSNAEITISGNGATNNVEFDLIQQVQEYSDVLENIQLAKTNSEEIIRILSDLKRVEDDSVRSYLSPLSGLLLGFIIAMLLLLLQYLIKFFRNYKPSF